MGLETQVAFEHTDPREGRAWPEYQRQNLGVCTEDSAEQTRGLGCAAKKNRRMGKRGRGLLSSFERCWEEVRNTEQTNGASQQHFRNANLVAASSTHYRGEMQSRGNYLG